MLSPSVSVQSEGPLEFFLISHPKFEAKISRFGGQLLSFKNQNNRDWFWLSDSAVLDGSKAIRGGIPICWPWFGPSNIDGKPQHGYARLAQWNITNINESADSLTIEMSPVFQAKIADNLPLTLTQTIVFSDQVSISLTTKNTSERPQEFTAAIHTYFHIDDVHNTQLDGLNGCALYDQLKSSNSMVEGKLNFTKHIDAIISAKDKLLELTCPGGQFNITGSGYDSVVVWNPWQKLASSMSDFDDDGFKSMVCVEMANTTPLILKSGQSHTLTQTIEFATKV